MNRLVIPSIVAGSGSGGKIDENRIIIKDSVIPEATEEQLGKIYCYSGETNATYIHGYIYECKGAEEAQSITTDFNPGKMAFDYEAATHPYKTFTSDAEAMSDFITSILKIDNPYDIVSGSLVVDENTIVDPNQHLEMWFVNCTNKNGQEVLANYKINASDLEAYGFQFTNPAADYHANEPIAYTFNWVTTIGDIHWERIDVQPISGSSSTVEITSTTPSLALTDNTFYNCTNALTSLTITSIPASNMYGIEIHFTTDVGFTGVTFPQGTLYTGTIPTWEAGKTYLINIQRNIVVAAEIKTME